MVKKYYIDASIWIDYYENRSDRLRPLGEWALRLFQGIIEDDDVVLYSDLLIEEICNAGYEEGKVKEILGIIKSKNLVKIEPTEKQLKEARRLASKFSIPKGDAIHAILARDYNAILIYRDKHFYELHKITKIKKPEEVI